jgi:hypothetical protein
MGSACFVEHHAHAPESERSEFGLSPPRRMAYDEVMSNVTPHIRVLLRQLALMATLLSALAVLGHTLLGVVVAWLTVDPPPLLAACTLSLTAVTLAVGLLRRSGPILMSGFVLGNLGALTLLPASPRDLLLNGAHTDTLLLSLLVYLAACTRWCDRDAPMTLDYEERFMPREVRAARLVDWRAFAAAALLALPLIALSWTGQADTTAQDNGRTVFSSLLVIFLWSVGVYLFLIAPSISPTADAREAHGFSLPRPLPHRLLWRSALSGLFALLAAGILWWLALREI